MTSFEKKQTFVLCTGEGNSLGQVLFSMSKNLHISANHIPNLQPNHLLIFCSGIRHFHVGQQFHGGLS